CPSDLAHTREHAHREDNFLERIALVEMHATLHRGHWHVVNLADHQPAGMPDGRRARKVRNFLIVDARGCGQLIGESTQPAAQHQTNTRAQLRLRENELRGALGASKLVAGAGISFRGHPAIIQWASPPSSNPERTAAPASPHAGVESWSLLLHSWGGHRAKRFRAARRNKPAATRAHRAHSNIPTIEADIRLAIVPASMARMPSRASSLRLLGASAPIPPIWMPMELKLAKPHSANVAMVNERGSSVAFIGPRNENATSSLSTMRVPSRLPMLAQSRHGTPITQATGANTQPKICCRLEGNQASPCGASQL